MSYRDWIVAKLTADDNQEEIKTIVPIGNSLINIELKNGKELIVGVVEGRTITAELLFNIYTDEAKKPNILIAKSKSIWEGSAIEYARQGNMGWGGMGEVITAFDHDNYSEIQKREYAFVEKNLAKHSKVSSLERKYDRIFKIYRKNGLSPFTITLINSYELSAEEVRHAKDTYGDFDAILKTNPNGNPTGQAYTVAEEINVEIFLWSELLSRLNKR